jgi:hypothetical protein
LPLLTFDSMLLRPKKVFLTVLILLLTLAAASCMKIRGPGIMPVLEENVVGEWVVVRECTHPVGMDNVEKRLQWEIMLQYVPGEDDRRIASSDISITFDGKPIPFTFEEKDQTLKAAVTAVFSPSLVHFFILDPAEESTLSFPSLELVIR